MTLEALAIDFSYNKGLKELKKNNWLTFDTKLIIGCSMAFSLCINAVENDFDALNSLMTVIKC